MRHDAWVPTREQWKALTGTLPKERIIFDGEYEVSDTQLSYFPPPAIHVSDEERFRNPRGIWERVVACYLSRTPEPAYN